MEVYGVIYQATCLVSGKVYVGQTKDFLKRYKYGHKTRKKMSEAQTGEKHPGAKLTEKEVMEIRENYILRAKEYNVKSAETIRHIIIRKSWSHI